MNHAFLIFFDPVFNCQLTLGANANGLTIEPLSVYNARVMHLFQPVDPNKGLEIGLRALMEWLNKPYDFAGLVGMIAVEVAWKLGCWEIDNPLGLARRLFCSEYVKMVLISSGYVVLPETQPGCCDPAQLCQALLKMPDQFASAP